MIWRDSGAMPDEKNGPHLTGERQIEESLKRALKKLEEKTWKVPPPDTVGLMRPRKREWGDFSSQLPFLLARLNEKNPRECGEILREHLEGLEEVVESIEIEGGFLNFTLSYSYLENLLKNILKDGERFPPLDIGKGERVLIEFVSANPTGPLHIGHGRGAVLGSALASLLEKGGYRVEREYYVNNVGRQIELLGESVSLRIREARGEEISFSPDHYRGEYLKELVNHYWEELSSHEKDIPYLAEFASRKILEDILKDLKSLGVDFDHIKFEDSLYREGKVEEVIQLLKEKGGVYSQDGAWWINSSRFGDEKDRVVVRADGRPTYLASDIAYHWEKFSRGYRILINIWGADHHGYVPRLRSALKFLNLPEENLRIILVQMVSLIQGGKKIPLSTRKGEFITLKELVEEVGGDVCRFFFLTRRPDTQLEFDIDLAKKSAPENPVYYVQYAHARISSIFRKWGREKVLSLSPGRNLDNPMEKELLRILALYPWVLRGAIKSLEPHRIVSFLLELATAFHRYYDQVRILGSDKEVDRLSLLEGVRKVIASGLKILGIEPKEKM